ncbi:D-alanyl-D-alanine carboxypeptidase family protein [Chlamydia abortus]|uniref:D-alanyl-d-alanine carboxypeptidase n=1 Tax=Chlamydia abortus (strain DSM 27085 / S26/3) TaxID=218497 RepID=Q5L743_CHLAB|nr:D-alanyl-D-alanine carboxypeptidase family protein [Chlamydia abortus]CAH63526.1 putative D-alanyl-d-alanine carboxypeptidase [Chlamydia abortus S26/3]SFV98620.1 D-alanyl-d-alanine carboxypeptidase [Chlamydia abortus]SFV99033.1 D-alanyl-d-alanine carboxypeptidase [Chlamydia abortus]SFW00478.1 D-alanyl-d-alanine carboxypeptidase [Chlamydia abortus]SFW00698.1 D-alanyl-d-alanine carboxypeptidase [Chlamydia abortus]
MIRVFFTFALLPFLAGLFTHPVHGQIVFPETRGNAVAVVHTETGKVLYAKDLDKRIYPASMTKIATALFILKKHPDVLNRFIIVKPDAIASITPQAKKQSGYRSPPHWLETDGVTIQLQNKEEVSGWDLFHALLICSANDAANALAIACSGSVAEFMKQLNQFLRELGCDHTHFNNPHGLHHPDHYTTAGDLIRIMREGLKEPLFRQVIRTTNYTMAPTNLSEERILHLTNKLILPGSTYYYPPALGGKTGTTKDAGRNLVFAAKKHGRSIITIAAGYSAMSELYEDVIALCEGVFNEQPLRRYLIPPTETYPLRLGLLGKISIPLPDGVYYDFYASEGEEPKTVSFVPHATKLPIQKGDLLGHWVFRNVAGERVRAEPLYASDTLHPSVGQKIRLYTKRIITSYRTYIVLTLVLLYYRKTRVHRRKSSRYYL